MTHYEQLGIEQTADQASVEEAWRLMASTWHPDKFARRSPRDQLLASGKYRAASEAHDVLRDPARRASYDRTLESDGPSSPQGLFERVFGRKPTARQGKGIELLKATIRAVRG